MRRFVQEARWRLPGCLEDIDHRRPRGLNRWLAHSLTGRGWVRSHRNMVITGPWGTGDTQRGCTLGNAASRKGFPARYRRMPRLLAQSAAGRPGAGALHGGGRPTAPGADVAGSHRG